MTRLEKAGWRFVVMEGNPTVQDVLQRFYSKYLGEHTPNARQAKSVVHILNCKTGA